MNLFCAINPKDIINQLQANVNFLFLKKPSENEKLLIILGGIEIEYCSEMGQYIKHGNFTKFPDVEILWKGTVSA